MARGEVSALVTQGMVGTLVRSSFTFTWCHWFFTVKSVAVKPFDAETRIPMVLQVAIVGLSSLFSFIQRVPVVGTD